MEDIMTTRGKVITPQYAAGFFDADGGVNICYSGKKKTSYDLSVMVYNTKREVIDAFWETYGGSVRTRTRSNPNWADSHEWKASAKVALSFLEDIYPHLIIKKDRVAVAIEFQTLKRSKKYRFAKRIKELSDFYELCYQKLRRMNKKGKSDYYPQRLNEETLKREATVRTALKNADLSRNDSSALKELRQRGLKGAAANKVNK